MGDAEPAQGGDLRPNPQHGRPRDPFMSLRSLVLLIGASLVGGVCGLLMWAGTSSMPGALLTAAGAFGGALRLLHELVE